jgi:hypothetical protein
MQYGSEIYNINIKVALDLCILIMFDIKVGRLISWIALEMTTLVCTH